MRSGELVDHRHDISRRHLWHRNITEKEEKKTEGYGDRIKTGGVGGPSSFVPSRVLSCHAKRF